MTNSCLNLQITGVFKEQDSRGLQGRIVLWERQRSWQNIFCLISELGEGWFYNFKRQNYKTWSFSKYYAIPCRKLGIISSWEKWILRFYCPLAIKIYLTIMVNKQLNNNNMIWGLAICPQDTVALNKIMFAVLYIKYWFVSRLIYHKAWEQCCQQWKLLSLIFSLNCRNGSNI